jgi:hypothetical protein
MLVYSHKHSPQFGMGIFTKCRITGAGILMDLTRDFVFLNKNLQFRSS